MRRCRRTTGHRDRCSTSCPSTRSIARHCSRTSGGREGMSLAPVRHNAELAETGARSAQSDDRSRPASSRRELRIGPASVSVWWFPLESRSGAENDSALSSGTPPMKPLADQLIQAEKSAADVLTAGIDHELNNPCSAFSASAKPFRKKGSGPRQRLRARHRRVTAGRWPPSSATSPVWRLANRKPTDAGRCDAQLEQALAIVQTSHECLGLNVQKHYVPISP